MSNIVFVLPALPPCRRMPPFLEDVLSVLQLFKTLGNSAFLAKNNSVLLP